MFQTSFRLKIASVQSHYQSIQAGQEFYIAGKRRPYNDYPHLLIRVLDPPPPFDAAAAATGTFFPSLRVMVLKRLFNCLTDAYNQFCGDYGTIITIPFAEPYPIPEAWSDISRLWVFRRLILEPAPSDLAKKNIVVGELEALPTSSVLPNFPGGSDYLDAVARNTEE